MQNNVTELTQKLLRSLDSNYNVIDMPSVIEIISLLEKVAITKELLETTRLGKHVNELRRNTTNESLAKRAKELVKKWRSMVLPDTNGQLKSSDQDEANQLKNKKRPPKDKVENANLKRSRLNGQMNVELDFSDNSNSSFKDVILNANKIEQKRGIILINSDSNSSLPDAKQDPLLEQQLPKKRGRKKGSKNHRNLLDEAETSFTNKMAVSRGNAKVKTTQELVASLQNKNSTTGLNLTATKPIEDLNERAAKLTERVSIIDQKLNTNSNRYKNSQRKNLSLKNNVIESKNEKVLESGSFTNLKSSDRVVTSANSSNTDDEIIVVDDLELDLNKETEKTSIEENVNVITSLSVEDALAQLPPVDRSTSEGDDDFETPCSCFLQEHKSDFSIEEDADVNTEHRFEFVEDHNCLAKVYLERKYHLGSVTDDRVYKLHNTCIPNVNGNFSIGSLKSKPQMQENGLYVNVVPNVNTEYIEKDLESSLDFSCENFKKYNVSDTPVNSDKCENLSTDKNSNLTSEKSDNSEQTFCEWHEVVETPSYNGEILKILPYVIID